MLVCDRDHVARIFRMAHMLVHHPNTREIEELERMVRNMTNTP
jgi:hypothetical protein